MCGLFQPHLFLESNREPRLVYSQGRCLLWRASEVAGGAAVFLLIFLLLLFLSSTCSLPANLNLKEQQALQNWLRAVASSSVVILQWKTENRVVYTREDRRSSAGDLPIKKSLIKFHRTGVALKELISTWNSLCTDTPQHCSSHSSCHPPNS